MILMSVAAVILAAQTDVNVFAEYVCGVKQSPVHEEIQDHWSHHDDSYVEEHRGIGKTVQAAIRSAWDIGCNPAIRIKYLQQSDEEAKKTVRMVRHFIESPRYQQVFPHVQPDPSGWTAGSLRVLRDGESVVQRDATIEGRGIFGRAGGRWDILYADDICDLRNAVQHPALRDQVKEAWNNTWLPMADVSAGTPEVRKIGTCYHVSDITADWRRSANERGSLLRHPVVDFESPWRRVFTREYLRRKREDIGPIAFGRAYELIPVSAEQIIFDPSWLTASFVAECPDYGARQSRTIAAFDFAFTEKRQNNDPDYSVCLIGRLYPDGHLYIVDMLRVRATFPEFVDKALAMCERWNAERGVGEGNGPQKGLVQQINKQSRFPVTALDRDRDKVTRAAAKQAFVESKRFHILCDPDVGDVLQPKPTLRMLYDEITTFPAGDHDDTVDAAIDLMDLAITRPASTGTTQSKAIRDPKRDELARLYG